MLLDYLFLILKECVCDQKCSSQLLCFFVSFLYLFLQNGTKKLNNEAKMKMGPSETKMGPGREKGATTSKTLCLQETPKRPPVDPQNKCLFLMLFRKASFSVLGRFLGAQGAQKGARMEVKWRPKRSWGHLLLSAEIITGAMIAAREGASGRVREAIFSRPGLQIHSGGVLGSNFADFK